MSTSKVSGKAHPADAFDLLGGKRLLKGKPSTLADIHSYLVAGIPYAVLFHLTNSIKAIAEPELASVFGVSARTLRRQKETPNKPMPVALASRTWSFAEILAKASEVFGSPDHAQRWMLQEAMGLDGARPIDLLRTVQGTELVKEFLGRLDHGVYN